MVSILLDNISTEYFIKYILELNRNIPDIYNSVIDFRWQSNASFHDNKHNSDTDNYHNATSNR
jgi:hypothetical protein